MDPSTISDTTPDANNWFSSFFASASSSDNNKANTYQILPTCYKLSDFYNMGHKKRGVALIFNHETFDDAENKKRDGTEKDQERLEKMLKHFQFQVRSYKDLKYGKIISVLKDLSKENHIDHDCLAIFVMSHGTEKGIASKDHEYQSQRLWENFTGNNCPTLAGKPKLFFIQACRGASVDDGAKIKSTGTVRADSAPTQVEEYETYTVPVMADILVMYSAFEGYFSWRSPEKGSWFIQGLCEELESNSYCLDLLQMLTFVNRRIAIHHESSVPKDKTLDKKKQICTIVSTLTRIVYFIKKSVDVEFNSTSDSPTEVDGNVQKLTD